MLRMGAGWRWQRAAERLCRRWVITSLLQTGQQRRVCWSSAGHCWRLASALPARGGDVYGEVYGVTFMARRAEKAENASCAPIGRQRGGVAI